MSTSSHVTIALLLALLLMGCRLVLIGDSHTAGACTDNPCESFPEMLEDSLAPWYYDVTAIGVPGSPMVYWGVGDDLYIQNEVAATVSGATVQVLLGSNDSHFGYPAVSLVNATSILIDKLYADGATRAVLVPPPPSPYSLPERQELLRQYRMAVLNLCAERADVECAPDPWDFLGADDFGPGDAHMNQQGHDLMADALTSFYVGAN